MDYFKDLISKIEDIEDSFSILNNRIIEFGKTTDYKYIDFKLVAKYKDILEEHINFLKKRKKELLSGINDNSKKEYLASRTLVEKRLEELISKMQISLAKIKKISSLKKSSASKKTTKQIFKSSKQMDEIKSVLQEIKKQFVLYKKYQKLLGIELNLKDDVEERLENTKDKFSFLKEELKFIGDSINILEEIIENKESRKQELLLRKQELFFYLSAKGYDELFSRIFQKKYELDLDLKKSALVSDLEKFKKFNEKVDLLLDIGNFCDSIKRNISFLRGHRLDYILTPFNDICLFLNNEILASGETDFENIFISIEKKISIPKLKYLLSFSEAIGEYKKNYSKLKNMKFDNLEYYYNKGFVQFFKGDERFTPIFLSLLKELTTKLNKDFRKQNISIKNIENLETIMKSKLEYIISIYDSLLSANKLISNYNYSYSKNLSKLDKQVLSNLLILQGLSSYKDIASFYTVSASKAFQAKREAYLASQRSSYRSSSSRSSSSSSSSWSSSSSSFSSSSSYSSSGSSSW